AQQPKKSRRGLGRGLGALIQNTSEEELPVEGSPDESPDTGANELPPIEEEKNNDAVIIDKPPMIDLSEPAEAVESRYLDGVKPTPSRRRPSDLFFGDDTVHASSAARSKASRAAMPNPILERPRKKAAESESDEPADDETVVDDSAQDAPAEDSHALLNAIQVDAIVPNPRQPREEFDQDAMVELVASVAEVGVLQPIVIRPTDSQGKYELIMGERRWRASKR